VRGSRLPSLTCAGRGGSLSDELHVELLGSEIRAGKLGGCEERFEVALFAVVDVAVKRRERGRAGG
jgi:hypothetical protein